MRKRRRVALFANGWNDEYVQEFGHGACKRARELDVDIFAFINYSTHGCMIEEENRGELNVFLLPDLRDFDGVLLLTNSLNQQRELDYLHGEILRIGIPAISTECELEGTVFFGTDNYSGMHDLAVHVFGKHGVRDVLFMGGPKEHREVQARLQAVLDAAGECSVEIPEKNILFADWSAASAQHVLEDWLQENETVPEAIICANDIMAVGVCDWLGDHGYKVPDDVKVTGFDCIRAGQNYEPMITSVNREWFGMGYQALNNLMDQVEGREVQPRISISTRLVCGESCGCELEVKKAEVQAELGRNDRERAIDGLASDQHFRHLYLMLRKNHTIEDLNQGFARFFRNEVWMEGNNFMLCTHPRLLVMGNDEEICKEPGYPAEMDVIVSLKDGKPEGPRRLPTKEAMFLAAERSEEPGLYIYVSVRSDDKNLGFAMLTRNLNILRDNILYIWTRHMNEYMDQILANVKIAELTKKLEELSVTDALTGVYNRMGCERILYPFLEECQNKGGRGVVMLADIDRMKTINDKFGHVQGDLALQTVADVLKTELPKGFLVARYGGDEFFIAGECEGDISVSDVAKHVSKQLAREVERRKIDFPLSISIGGVHLERGEAFRLGESLQKADDFMYRVKEKHHKEIDGKI